MNNFNDPTPFEANFDPSLFGGNDDFDDPNDPVWPDPLSVNGPNPYNQSHNQQYNSYTSPYPAGNQNRSQNAFDPYALPQQQSLSATMQSPYPPTNVDQYENPYHQKEFQHPQHAYLPGQSGPDFDNLLAQQQQPFPSYEHPASARRSRVPKKASKKAPNKAYKKKAEDSDAYEVSVPKKASKRKAEEPVMYETSAAEQVKRRRTSQKAPKNMAEESEESEAYEAPPKKASKRKAEEPVYETSAAEQVKKRRISQKAPRKAPKSAAPSPREPQEDETDYSCITTLLPVEEAVSAAPGKKYWSFMKDHLEFVLMRLAGVCVGLVRIDNADEAQEIGQFAVDFFGEAMWAIALKHYINASMEGDEFESMKPCMADCIGTFKQFYGNDVAQDLQDKVVMSGLWYQQPIVG